MFLTPCLQWTRERLTKSDWQQVGAEQLDSVHLEGVWENGESGRDGVGQGVEAVILQEGHKTTQQCQHRLPQR